jgi:hypothetical protein
MSVQRPIALFTNVGSHNHRYSGAYLHGNRVREESLELTDFIA